MPGAVEEINESLQKKPSLLESAVMALAQAGGPPQAPLPELALFWEDEISETLASLELRMTSLEGKIDLLCFNATSKPPAFTSPWWYLRTMHRGIHTMSPYLIAGYIALQLMGKLKK